MSEACDLTAVEARRLIGARELSPLELLESCLGRIEATNAAVNAIVAIDAEAGRRQAKAIGDAIQRGDDLGLLGGPAVGLKDLQATAGLRTTWGSLLFKDHVPREDDLTRRQCAQGRRHHLRQDQHAGVRRRLQHHQPRVRRRPAIRSIRS